MGKFDGALESLESGKTNNRFAGALESLESDETNNRFAGGLESLEGSNIIPIVKPEVKPEVEPEVKPEDNEYTKYLQMEKNKKFYAANKEKVDALIEKTYQNELRLKYENMFPQYFTDGKLTDFKGAESAGIAYKSTINAGGAPTVAGNVVFADEDDFIDRQQLIPKGSEDKSFRSDVSSVDEQMDKMLTIQDRDKIGERYTYAKPPRDVKVDFDTYLLSDTFQERMKDSPLLKKWAETFGSGGAKFLAGITTGAMYVRGGTADIVKTAHEALDDGTDGNFTKLLKMDSTSGAKKFTGDLGQILEVSEKAGILRYFTKIPKASILADDIFKAEIKRKKKLLKATGKVKKIENRRLNINKAKNAEIEVAANKAKAASLKAKENQFIKEELIIDYEVKIGARDANDVNKILNKNKIVSKIVAGKLTIDFEKARIVGQRIAKAEYNSVKSVEVDGDLIGKDDFGDVLNISQDDLLAPILLPDKLDPLIAVASDLRKLRPELFQGKMTIDALFNATVKGDLIASDELLGLLNKYDLNFEEYIAMTIGSASQAGKVMQKVSMIKGRKVGASARDELLSNSKIEKRNFWKKAFQRTVDVGRGALVSMFATMVRNVESTLIRSPLESLASVPNTLLYNITEEGLRKGNLEYLLKINNWRGQLRNSTYLFDNLDVKDFVDYILDRPDFRDKFDVLFTQLSEIKKLKGPDVSTLPPVQKFVNMLLEGGEDLVDTLNTFNKWQDHLTRRSYFLSSLETLVKRNYNGLDLIEELKKGRMKEFLNDSPTIMTKDSKPFAELVAEATETARNATYSNMPNFSPFKYATKIITETGLTAVFAFPRFVFTSLELIAQYSAGIAMVPIKRSMRLLGDNPRSVYAKLNERDLEDISRNLVGLGMYQAATIYRMPEKDRPEVYQGYVADPHPNYKLIRTNDGKSFDTTPQFPMRQLLYIAEFGRRSKTFGNDTIVGSVVGTYKEFAETFLGATLKTGQTTSLVEDFILAVGGDDEDSFNRIVKGGGKLLGTFGQRYWVPAGQIVDLERGLTKQPIIKFGQDGQLIQFGLVDTNRSTSIKDVNKPYNYDDPVGNLKQQLLKPLYQRGFLGVEEDFPDTTYVMDPDGKQRPYPLLKVFGGLSFYEDNPPDSLFLEKYGFTEWNLGSKETNPQVRAFENKLMGSLIPAISKVAQSFEKGLLKKNELHKGKLPFRQNPNAPPLYSPKYIQATVRGIVSSSLTTLRGMFKESAYSKLLDKSADMQDRQKIMDITNSFLKETHIKKFKRLPKDIRQQAKQIFEQENRRSASYDKGGDMVLLFAIGNAYYKAQNILK